MYTLGQVSNVTVYSLSPLCFASEAENLKLMP